MERSFCHFILVAVLLLVHYSVTNAETSNIDNDRSSLLALKSQITSDPYNSLTNNWTTKTSVCSWIGVTCDFHHSRVTKLDISDMGLVGTIPPEIGNLSLLVNLNTMNNFFHGPIPPSIFNVSSLETIFFANNSLSGSLPTDMCRRNFHRLRIFDLSLNDYYGEIPLSLDQCSKLEIISLGNNHFAGNVPRGIGNLTLLKHILLGGNNLSGTIPEEIGLLNNLKELNMKANKLTGPLPTNILNTSSLESIDISYNSLSGSLPVHLCNLHRNLISIDISENMLDGEIQSSFGRCSKLQVLWMSSNRFSGPLPSAIGNLTLLRELQLDDNSLSGPIPNEIGRLNNLAAISMGFNKLTGAIPSTIFNVSSLTYIYISNNTLTGELPVEIGNVTGLWDLELSDNYLSGNIPRELFTANINIIDISNNLLEGSIPSEIERSPNMGYLNLAENRVSGTLPSTIGNLSDMSFLVLYSNKLSGEIPPSICNLKSLTFFHLSSNNLVGPIPNCLGNLTKSLEVLHLKSNYLRGLVAPATTFPEGCVLQSLNLNGNKFAGKLPQSLVNCGQLQVLDVGNNEIQDTFPFWMETLPKLRVLVLRSNRFNGTVSLGSKTTTTIPPFPSLQVFDISHNEFTGPLPVGYLENFASMIDAKEISTVQRNWFSYYEESMVFVLKGLELPVTRILETFTTIDMSDNKFSDTIPQFIGKLNSLRYLNLSHNSITGSIPISFGNMSILESLDLSSNQLVGEIPWQLTKVIFLSKLNLSFNNLAGQIPQSSTGQFPTFDNSSYMGNSGLCGFPLTKKCKQDNVQVQSLYPMLPGDSDFLDGFFWQVVLLGYGCGFIFGATIGYFRFFGSEGKNGSWASVLIFNRR